MKNIILSILIFSLIGVIVGFLPVKNSINEKTYSTQTVMPPQDSMEIVNAAKIKAIKDSISWDSTTRANTAEFNRKWKENEKTKIGRLRNRHNGFEWTEDECQRILKHEIWIGMTVDMMYASIGFPNKANRSNYGYGDEWQFCYHKKNIYLYDKNDDGIIDSYN